MTARTLRWTELVIASVGFVLLSIYTVISLEKLVQSRVALAEFDSYGSSPVSRPSESDLNLSRDVQAQKKDVRSWAAKRIVAFKASWKLNSEPPIAVLRVPNIDLEVPVFGNTSYRSLNRGVGWIEGTDDPGGEGTTGIAGHRDGFFRRLRDVSRHDVMVLRTRRGIDTFRVTAIEIVNPEDISVLQRKGRSLVLITCYPFYYVGKAPQRFVVEGKLESRVWPIEQQEAHSIM